MKFEKYKNTKNCKTLRNTFNKSSAKSLIKCGSLSILRCKFTSK